MLEGIRVADIDCDRRKGSCQNVHKNSKISVSKPSKLTEGCTTILGPKDSGMPTPHIS
jgi:hypothetical protein